MGQHNLTPPPSRYRYSFDHLAETVGALLVQVAQLTRDFLARLGQAESAG